MITLLAVAANAHHVSVSHPVGAWQKALEVVLWFAGAWLVARLAGWVALRVVSWRERQHVSPDDTLAQDLIRSYKRQQTTVSMVRASIATAAFAVALALSLATVAGGLSKLETVLGASFVVIVLAFALQRVLIDVIAGAVMFFEHWYSVGDTIVLSNIDVQGVVEDVSLRRTRLRALNGEVINVHNSQITAVRVLPSGVKRLAVELFVYELAEGEALVSAVAQIVPVSPTCFVHRPALEEVEKLSDDLYRLRVICEVAPGREWLVEGFFIDLLKERGESDLVVHGPVAFAVDESATRQFARAAIGTRQGRDAVRASVSRRPRRSAPAAPPPAPADEGWPGAKRHE